jgi:hypothetical protein
MSTKDRRYYRECCICNDQLPGTDDGLEVWESLKGQLEELDATNAAFIPNCTLCGEACKSIKHAREIVAKGEPPMFNAKTGQRETLEDR